MRRLLHPAEEICQIMAQIYGNKLTTVSGGNLSIRDGEGNVWVSPSGGDKACLKRGDVCRILENGEVCGHAKPSLEFKIHKGVYDRRPDIRAVLHAHSPALVAMSIMHELPDVKILPDLYALIGKAALAPYALPGSEALVENVGSVFAKGYDTVILENHGVFLGSKIDLFDAYKKFEALELAACSQLMAKSIGKAAGSLTDEQLEKYGKLSERKYGKLEENKMTNEELLLRQEICRFTKRAYDKRIFGVSQGVYSAKLSTGGMIITPLDADNSALDEKELVRVEGDRCEAGKMPSIMAGLHGLIYKYCGDIRSIITAASPYAGIFVTTGEPYDVRVIPECFNRLQACRTFDFDTFLDCPEAIGEYLTLNTPVAIVANGFYIVCSVSPFAAYDRMEIFEYTARSVHYTKIMQKDIVKITDENIEALKHRFKIPKPEMPAL